MTDDRGAPTVKIYSLQRDRNGNMIVCGDLVERAGTYVIVATGSYREMLALKDGAQ